MSAAATLKAMLETYLTGWVLQFGRWVDGGDGVKHCIIQPTGGGTATLVRRPQFTVILIGAQNQANTVPYDAANAIIEGMRSNNGGFVVSRAGEPVTGFTDDGRAMVTFSVSTITN
jgi:hypothetical protein